MKFVDKIKSFGRKAALAASIALPFVSGGVSAEDSANKGFIRGGSLNSTWKSQYIGTRSGTVFAKGNMGVLQNTLDVNTKYGTVECWQNLNLEDGKTCEVDLGYYSPSLKFGKFEFSGAFFGFVYPDFDRAGWDFESDVTAAYHGPVDVSLTGCVAYPRDMSPGAVGKLTVGKSFSLGKDRSNIPMIRDSKLTLEGSLVYKHEYFDSDRGFSHYDLTGKLEIPVTKRFTISPGVMYHGVADSFGGKIKEAWVPFVGGTWKW